MIVPRLMRFNLVLPLHSPEAKANKMNSEYPNKDFAREKQSISPRADAIAFADDKPPSYRPAMATIQDDDERLLAQIGYKQVSTATSRVQRNDLTLQRNFVASSPSGPQSRMRYPSSVCLDRSRQHMAFP